MTSDDCSKIVLSFARTLFLNGQATEQTVSAAESLGRALGLRATIMPRWGELQLVGEDGTSLGQVAALPAGVEMDRVASTMRAVEDVASGRLSPDAAMSAIGKISQSPPAPTWLFALAAAAGAVALAVIFGIRHLPAAGLIFASAAAGALLRRGLARM